MAAAHVAHILSDWQQADPLEADRAVGCFHIALAVVLHHRQLHLDAKYHSPAAVAPAVGTGTAGAAAEDGTKTAAVAGDAHTPTAVEVDMLVAEAADTLAAVALGNLAAVAAGTLSAVAAEAGLLFVEAPSSSAGQSAQAKRVQPRLHAALFPRISRSGQHDGLLLCTRFANFA